ncbi:shikimate dehydrogenase [Muriicola jejuensis]|uniref:Shikimate dehydrogenase n=1 Tax=Muriicola jejuensis TaxID=504488 RepID=A0A6P0UCM6_9FLAO|nr:shikimate dehydrogenase [Muriicola jejuensis]NER10797.1 shikimate dehydrogenase [Muriicola jejuensis]SMP16241.1 shikimate dehydrogenase [Muriicola jejuensis]
MEKTEKKNRFGLLGRNISYSFSKGYFTRFFKEQGLNHLSYENFDLKDISDLETLLKEEQDLGGLNVTIPYKQQIIPYLHRLHPEAREIGAVNTVKFTKTGLEGYNTDAYGFRRSLEPFLSAQNHSHALILGTGGASLAIAFSLKQLGIDYIKVSRQPGEGQWAYDALSEDRIKKHTLIINCTPLGTFPRVEEKPALPYQYLGAQHLLYDLVYNPEKTAFMKAGEKQGATATNGLAMLEFQAQKAWEIWRQGPTG